MRGESAIKAAALEAQKAATRNAKKGDYHRIPLKVLFDLLEEETYEFYEAVLSGDKERICEELGDFLWTGTMIASHGGQLVGFEEEVGS